MLMMYGKFNFDEYKSWRLNNYYTLNIDLKFEHEKIIYIFSNLTENDMLLWYEN